MGFSVPIILGNRHILTLSRCEKRLCIGGKKLPAQGSISRLLHLQVEGQISSLLCLLATGC